MRRAIMCVAMAASAFLGAMTAARAEDGQMRVKVADLNLATSDGARAALARISAGAKVFCDVGSGRETLDRVAAENRCVSEMTRKGVDLLHAPLVTALLEGAAPAQDRAAVALAAR